MTNQIVEEHIKLAKEFNQPLECECGQELDEETYRENSGLCNTCVRQLGK